MDAVHAGGKPSFGNKTWEELQNTIESGGESSFIPAAIATLVMRAKLLGNVANRSLVAERQ